MNTLKQLQENKEEIYNNIFIGNNVGALFTIGNHNVFLGDGAGETETKINNTFIIKIGDREERFIITDDEWEIFNKFFRQMIESVREDALRNPLEEALNMFKEEDSIEEKQGLST